jgi:hypothetical protein
MSSSDEEELDRLENEGEMSPRHLRHQVQREAEARVDAMKIHAKEYRPRNNHEGWRGDGHPAKADDEEVDRLRQEHGDKPVSSSQGGIGTESGAKS